MAGLTDNDIDQLINNMSPGKNMDYLVAKTLGQTKFDHPWFTRVEEVKEDYLESKPLYICPICATKEGETKLCVKPYSTYIVPAWEVVKWWQANNGDLFIEWWNDGEWFICNENLFNRKDKRLTVIQARSNQINWGSDELPSFPLAICRMALRWGVANGLLTVDDLISGIESYGSKD